MKTSIALSSSSQLLVGSSDLSKKQRQKLSDVFDLACVLFAASKKLCYPIDTAGTALIILHRFTSEIGDERILQSNKAILLVTILFLSGKITEQFRRNREILAVVLRLCGYPHDVTDDKRQVYTNICISKTKQLFR